ncbi:hypothetical protein [Fluviicola sp.]|jgi:hypothetical protein|nr:hypothetical protein [Fluviicola sp.]
MSEIEELELKFNNGNPLPGACREFLTLGGKNSNLGDIDIGPGFS